MLRIFLPRRHLVDPRLVSTFGDLGQQGGQRLAQVADDGDIRRYILAHFGPVDLKVDNLGLLGEAVQIAGDAVIKTHAQGDENVAALDRTVGVCLAVHAGHAEIERMRLRDVARAQQRGDHWNVGLLDQLQQRLSCAGELDAVAGDDQRPICLVDHLRSLIDLAAVDLGPRFETGQVDLHVVAERAHGVLHILTDVDQNGARPAFTRDVERFLQD